MKKSILIFSGIVTSLSLTAFGFINWNNTDCAKPIATSIIIETFGEQTKNHFTPKKSPDFFYDVSTRFSPLKKEVLDQAETIFDFLPKEETQGIEPIESVSLIIVVNDQQTGTRETGKNPKLTKKQVKLLQNSSYSTNFSVKVKYLEKSNFSDKMHPNYVNPHFTIVPEIQAEYVDGKEALLEFLRENTLEDTKGVTADKVHAAKLYFTIDKEGKVSKTRLDRSCGYEKVDEQIIQLISNAPGKWKAAENSVGEKVEQELVVSFGIVGC